ncbi:MAG: monooxygenase, partial [Actinomycetota bacterium]
MTAASRRTASVSVPTGNGVALSEYWGRGMRSLHGIQVHGFPTMFVIGFAQGATQIAHVPHNYVENGLAIADVIRHAESVGATRIETTQTAEQEWLSIITSNQRGLRGNPDCTPGYYNNEGQPISESDMFNGSGHPGGPV